VGDASRLRADADRRHEHAANGCVLVTGFRDFLGMEFPHADVTEISGSNNLVYLVSTAGGPLIAKEVIDTDIPLNYLAEANARLAQSVPTQTIHRVLQVAAGDPFDAVFAEYVEGRDLSGALAEDEAALPTERLVAFLCRFIAACREMPIMGDGFGLYKREAPRFGTHQEFAEFYARRYWSRVRPCYDGDDVQRAVDQWLDGGFRAAAEKNTAPTDVMAVDANLKNFVLRPDGRIVVLNVPIAARSTPAHAAGAVGLHLRNRGAHRPFLDAVSTDICPEDAAMVPHYELWGLLGILSFYAAKQPGRQREWRNWGSRVLLDDDFRNLVTSHFTS
jgi:hypothetical protein